MNKTETAARVRLAQHNNTYVCVCVCLCVWWVNIIGVEAWTGVLFHIHFSWLSWVYVVGFVLVAEC